MTSEEQAKRTRELINSFTDEQPGDGVIVLAAAMQMLICRMADDKADALDMISAITFDMEQTTHRAYDTAPEQIAALKRQKVMQQ